MDKQKFEQAKSNLRLILEKQGGYRWNGTKTDIDNTILAKFDELLIDAARDLIAVVDESEKSEMPCNCCKEELAEQEAMAEMFDAVETFVTAINKLAKI